MSNADKRTVSTDALETLGTIIGLGEKRDAIHLAVEPVQAGTRLLPGEHIIVVNGLAIPSDEGIGIVDPFLEKPVNLGERFWLVVYPRKITSLRHVWTHPAFDEEKEDIPETKPELLVEKVEVGQTAEQKYSEEWLRDFCDGNDCPSYEDIISAIENGSISRGNDSDEYNYYYSVTYDGEYIHSSGADAHGIIPDEFWDHVEVVLGRKFGKGERAEYFSCSC